MIKFDNYSEPEYRINAGKEIIIGRTEIMRKLFHYLNHLADLPTTVLLRGETEQERSFVLWLYIIMETVKGKKIILLQ